jgi:hypothetical protein
VPKREIPRFCSHLQRATLDWQWWYNTNLPFFFIKAQQQQHPNKSTIRRNTKELGECSKVNEHRCFSSQPKTNKRTDKLVQSSQRLCDVRLAPATNVIYYHHFFFTFWCLFLLVRCTRLHLRFAIVSVYFFPRHYSDEGPCIIGSHRYQQLN